MFDLSFREFLDWFWRLSLAQTVTSILFIMSFVSFSVPFSAEVRPYFILMPLYYWTIYRPTTMLPIFVFLMGLIFDLTLGFPLGLHAILFLAVQWIIGAQRLFFMGQSYFILWLGFVLTAFFVLLIEWLFFSVLSGGGLAITPIITSFLLTVFFFPLITLLFVVVHRFLPVAPKSFI